MSLLILVDHRPVALIIHVVKTGRNQIWIWVLALLSCREQFAYSRLEILPELFAAVRRSAPPRGLRKANGSGADLRSLRERGACRSKRRKPPALREELVRHGTLRRGHRSYAGAYGLLNMTPISCRGSRRRILQATHPLRRTTLDDSSSAPIFAHRQGISCTPGA